MPIRFIARGAQGNEVRSFDPKLTATGKAFDLGLQHGTGGTFGPGKGMTCGSDIAERLHAGTHGSAQKRLASALRIANWLF